MSGSLPAHRQPAPFPPESKGPCKHSMKNPPLLLTGNQRTPSKAFSFKKEEPKTSRLYCNTPPILGWRRTFSLIQVDGNCFPVWFRRDGHLQYWGSFTQHALLSVLKENGFQWIILWSDRIQLLYICNFRDERVWNTLGLLLTNTLLSPSFWIQSVPFVEKPFLPRNHLFSDCLYPCFPAISVFRVMKTSAVLFYAISLHLHFLK